MSDQALYLSYINNFLTVEAFAEHYGVDTREASIIISNGKSQNEGSTTC